MCQDCPLKAACRPGRARRQINLTEHEDLLITARQALADPDTADICAGPGRGSSGCSACSRSRYGARKSRYIGRAKARLQAAWAAALVNLNPIGRHLAAQTS